MCSSLVVNQNFLLVWKVVWRPKGSPLCFFCTMRDLFLKFFQSKCPFDFHQKQRLQRATLFFFRHNAIYQRNFEKIEFFRQFFLRFSMRKTLFRVLKVTSIIFWFCGTDESFFNICEKDLRIFRHCATFSKFF